MPTAKKGKRKPNRNEFDKIVLNVEESKGREHDWGAEPTTSKEESLGAIDLSKGNSWFRRADNQGNTGSCVGHAVGKTLQFCFARKDMNPYRRKLSYRWLWEVSKEMDDYDLIPTTMFEDAGTYIKTCFHMARKFGCLTDRVYPMRTRKTIRGSTVTGLRHASKLKVLTYLGVRPGGQNSTAWSTYDDWLHKNGTPIVCRVGVDHNFQNAPRSKNGVIVDFDRSKVRGYHAIIIYGVDEAGNYLVLNSWGSRWGYRGASKMTREVAQANCWESYVAIV